MTAFSTTLTPVGYALNELDEYRLQLTISVGLELGPGAVVPLGDLHFPFHGPDAVSIGEKLIEMGKTRKLPADLLKATPQDLERLVQKTPQDERLVP